jgi:hypothetical protein
MARSAILVMTLPFIGLLLTSCGQTASLIPAASPDQGSEGKASSTEPFAQFKDIPIPGGAEMDMERSIILGSQDTWTGRVHLSSQHIGDQAVRVLQVGDARIRLERSHQRAGRDKRTNLHTRFPGRYDPDFGQQDPGRSGHRHHFAHGWQILIWS